MLLFQDQTEIIIKCFYRVYNALGFGFLEKVYENAMLIELTNEGLSCLSQVPVKVYYKKEPVGFYYTDILVEDKIILELKAGEGDIIKAHESQLLNYLKATEYELGMILHFGEKPGFKRKILMNKTK